MANCVTCKARCENAGQHRVKTDCVSYIPKDYPKPQTNADRIRAMTDEELAFVIAANSYETPPWCRQHEECPFIGLDHVPCEECALDWLNQEATE